MMAQVMITPRAARRVRAMAGDQGLTGRFGLRVSLPWPRPLSDTVDPAVEDFRLCLVAGPEEDDVVLPRNGFDLCLPREQAEQLDGLRIDLAGPGDPTGFVVGRDDRIRRSGAAPAPLDPEVAAFLATAAPDRPAGEPELVRQVTAALERVRPFLQLDGGDAFLVGARDGVAYLRFTGACSGCSALTVTLTSTVEQTVQSDVRAISRVQVVP